MVISSRTSLVRYAAMPLALRFLLAALLTSVGVHAQSPDAPAAPAAPAASAAFDAPKSAREADDIPYRYHVPSLAQTVRELQHASLAIQLREYCADEKIPDAFVDERLAEFSRITGREENCRTLLEYH